MKFLTLSELGALMNTKTAVAAWIVAIALGMGGVVSVERLSDDHHEDPPTAGSSSSAAVSSPPPSEQPSSPAAPESSVSASEASPADPSKPSKGKSKSPKKTAPPTTDSKPDDQPFLAATDVDAPDLPVERTVHPLSDKYEGVKSDDSYNACFQMVGGLERWLTDVIGEEQAKQQAVTYAVFTAKPTGDSAEPRVVATQTVLAGTPGNEDLAEAMFEQGMHWNTSCPVESGDFRTSDPRELSAGDWSGSWFRLYEGDTVQGRVAILRVGANVSTLHFAGDSKDETTDALLVQAAHRLGRA